MSRKEDALKLDKEIKVLIEAEREAQINVGLHLLEIDRRNLWKQKGFKSLYEFCELRWGYSADEVDEILGITLASGKVAEVHHK